MPFLDGDVESADKNASRKVGYFQNFIFAVVAESLGGKHNLLGLKKLEILVFPAIPLTCWERYTRANIETFADLTMMMLMQYNL